VVSASRGGRRPSRTALRERCSYGGKGETKKECQYVFDA